MRDAEHVRGLVEGKSEVVVQDDHRPLIGREPEEVAFQLVAVGESFVASGTVTRSVASRWSLKST